MKSGLGGWGWLLLTGLLFFGRGETVAAPYESGDACLDCHQRETPGLVRYWADSRHATGGVGCPACHAGDASANHDAKGRAYATADVCAGCHRKAARSHYASKHGVGFRSGRACTRNRPRTKATAGGCSDCHESDSGLPRHETECARFLTQSPEMQRRGCNTCHLIEDRCDTCHGVHSTDLEIVRDPAVCATCHMGPDHPQYEMWKSSRHGILFARKGRDFSPDCMRCHMPSGSHDVGFGMTMGLAGQPVPKEVREREREKMIGVCADCHTRSFAAQNLHDGDAVQKQAKAALDEAAGIIRELEEEDLLMPAPDERPAHPLSGHALEIGPQMLYEDLSRVEAVFFRMKKFYYVITYKGVYHQNPDYAHWYGNAPLKLALSELKSEARLLREFKRLRDRVDNLARSAGAAGKRAEDLSSRLRELKERYLRGDLERSDYEKEKGVLLDGAGL